MGVVPEDSVVGKLQRIGKGVARSHRLLRHPRHAVEAEVLPESVPVHRGGLVQPVHQHHRDAVSLVRHDKGTGRLAVERVGRKGPRSHLPSHQFGFQAERVSRLHTMQLTWPERRQRCEIQSLSGAPRLGVGHQRLEPRRHLRHQRMVGRHLPAGLVHSVHRLLRHQAGREFVGAVGLEQVAG